MSSFAISHPIQRRVPPLVLNKVNNYGIAKCPLFCPHPKKIVILSLIGLIQIIFCAKKNVTDIFNRS
jgi:hypothetical protein